MKKDDFYLSQLIYDELAMETGKKDLIYLYCITKEPPRINNLKSLSDELYYINYLGVFAVVSRVKQDEFGEENLRNNFTNLEWVKTKAYIHENLIEGVMQNNCVIPFKFGTIFTSESSLKACIKENTGKFNDSLNYLEGKEEWGIKIYCNNQQLKENINNNNEEMIKLDSEIANSSRGKTYLLKKKREALIDVLVNNKINVYGHEIFEVFKELSLNIRTNKLLPKEVTEKKDDMILNLVLLMGKDAVAKMIEAANYMKKKYSDKGLSIDYTGPWPPYNFCSIDEEIQK
ncbi:MAG: GvpL/GvpF family gas vesicle protein [Ignavibacteria bacterium]|jgi:hypothetical protein